jgi:hypothetical protein
MAAISSLTRYVHSFDRSIQPSIESERLNKILRSLIQAPEGLDHEYCHGSSTVDSDYKALIKAGWDLKGRYWQGHTGDRLKGINRSDLLQAYKDFSFEYHGINGNTLIIEFDDRNPGSVTILTPHLTAEQICKALAA